MAQWFSTHKVCFSYIPLFAFFFVLIFPFAALSQHSPKIPFPYGPMGLNGVPWIVAKEANLFEKNGLNVDMIFVGVSTVIVKSMLFRIRQRRGSWRTSGRFERLERRRHHPDRSNGTLFHPVPNGSPTDYGAWRPEREKKSASPDSERLPTSRFAPFWSETILRMLRFCRWADWRRRWRAFPKGRWMDPWFLLHIVLPYSSRGSAGACLTERSEKIGNWLSDQWGGCQTILCVR